MKHARTFVARASPSCAERCAFMPRPPHASPCPPRICSCSMNGISLVCHVRIHNWLNAAIGCRCHFEIRYVGSSHPRNGAGKKVCAVRWVAWEAGVKSLWLQVRLELACGCLSSIVRLAHERLCRRHRQAGAAARNSHALAAALSQCHVKPGLPHQRLLPPPLSRGIARALLPCRR